MMSNLYDETSPSRTYHLVEAEKVAKDVLINIAIIFDSSSPEHRNVYRWLLATSANLSLFINKDYKQYEEEFLKLADKWEAKSFKESQEIFSNFKAAE